MPPVHIGLGRVACAYSMGWIVPLRSSTWLRDDLPALHDYMSTKRSQPAALQGHSTLAECWERSLGPYQRCCQTPDFSLCILTSILRHLQVLELDQEMLKLAEQLKDATSLLIFARGFNYATALEAALKVGRIPVLT